MDKPLSIQQLAKMGIPPDADIETWESIYKKTLELAAKILDHCEETGEVFDNLIAIPRGSYYPINIVARELGCSGVDILHASIASYKIGAGGRGEGFIIGQMPTKKQLNGKNLLIIEEVCDTGHTLAYLNDRFKKAGAKLVRTGVLHYKPERSQTGFVPNWWVRQTDNWVVYPWEINEFNGRQADVK